MPPLAVTIYSTRRILRKARRSTPFRDLEEYCMIEWLHDDQLQWVNLPPKLYTPPKYYTPPWLDKRFAKYYTPLFITYKQTKHEQIRDRVSTPLHNSSLEESGDCGLPLYIGNTAGGVGHSSRRCCSSSISTCDTHIRKGRTHTSAKAEIPYPPK